jgi:hypothetical protein
MGSQLLQNSCDPGDNFHRQGYCPTGGLPQPGPRFQALPDPRPLPPLPMPSRPEAAFAPAGAPAGMPMPRASLLARQAKPGYMGIGRHLLEEIPDMPAAIMPEPVSAEAPAPAMAAPAGTPST